ncbi:MAG TPA: PAS domain S-box protein [Methanoregula sp.]|nr:PAS domain S-box protein [Methanoregula sp.]
MISVLYVDDEENLLDIAKIYLERTGDFSVETTTSVPGALAFLEERSFDAIVSDYQMPEMDGIAFLQQVRSSGDTIPFILFTGRGREEVVIQALNEGADFYIQKGGEPKSQFAELAHKVRQAVSQRHAENALKKTKQHYRTLIRNASEAIYVIQDGLLRMANPQLADILGYREEELASLAISTMIHEDDRAMVLERYSRRLKGEAIPRYSFRLRRRDRSIAWVDTSGILITWEGRPAVMVFLTDITEGKRAEESLQENEEKYRLVVENSRDAIYIHKDNRLWFVNRRSAEVTGYSVDELMQVNLWDLVHPDDRGRLQDAARRRFAGEAVPQAFTARLVTKSGELREGDFFVDRIDFHGKPAILGIFRDLTDQRKTEISLRESEEKYRILLHESPDPVFSFYPDGTYRYVNKAFADGVRKTPEEIIGKKIWDVFDKDEADKRFGPLSRVFATGKGDVIEVRVPHPGGDRYYITTITPIRDKSGTVITCICSSKEITDRKRAEDALRQANRHLGLLTDVTRHDLTNQVSALKGWLELTKAMLNDPQKIRTFIAKKEIAIAAIERQIAFMNAYQGLGTGEPSWQDLEAVLLQARELLPAEGIRFVTAIGSIEVYSDPLFDRVFSNLLDNTLRHGEHVTEIRVSSHHAGGELTIVWEDNGTGISPDEKERIFDRGFGRNTGFGMFLAKEILSLTGIAIRETGVAGKGARFEILVPAGAYREKIPQGTEPPARTP